MSSVIFSGLFLPYSIASISIYLFSYWPEMDEIVRAGQLVIVCQAKLDHLGPFVHREFLLTDERTGEMRVISHVQYLEWPDHGAPVLACQFLDYVRHVQTYSGNDCEEGAVVLVHCSAGIGRTGAFILLDSAMRLIQADCAVNPIHLVKMMRDQRPMMLQTSVRDHYVETLNYTYKLFILLTRFSSSMFVNASSRAPRFKSTSTENNVVVIYPGTSGF